MMQPDAKIAALPTLPKPYYDQKIVIQLYKAAALKCRTQHRDWVMHPKETITKYVKALGSEQPDWSLMRYSHEIAGELQEVFRCRIAIPLRPTVNLYGDALMANRADMTAALHALLYLLAKDLITAEGLPRLSPPRPSSDSASESTVTSSSSGSSIPPQADISSTSVSIASTSDASIVNASAQSDMTISVARSRSSSTSSISRVSTGRRRASISKHNKQPTLDNSFPDDPNPSHSPEPVVLTPEVEGDGRGHTRSLAQSTKVPPETGPTVTASQPADIPSKAQALQSSARARSPQESAVAAKPAVQTDAMSGPPGRHQISLESARGFIDFYCSKYKFPRADIVYNSKSTATTVIEAAMFIGGSRVGTGIGCNMKEATSLCYIDACMWMSSCDDSLWYQFQMIDATNKTRETRAAQLKNQQNVDYVPSVELVFSEKLDSQLREVIWKSRKSELHRQALRSSARAEAEVKRFKEQREKAAAELAAKDSLAQKDTSRIEHKDSYSYSDSMKMDALSHKSRELQERLERYRSDPRQAKMRETRASLPISSHTKELMKAIEENPVLVVMAQTGSGKTTQLPQIILDHHIAKGQGAACNVICTQPRRLAAISVAQRVAAERGEPVGRSVGYHVRFEHAFPERDGSILFMTSGIFLKRMQVGLEDLTSGKSSFLDEVSHVIVDEVHERDIDVDLLLFTLRRQLQERRKAGKPEFKVGLMSATIDLSLFRNYFPGPRTGNAAPYLEIPGRTYPVKKYYLNEIYKTLQRHPLYQSFRWVFEENEVKPYLARELQTPLEQSVANRTDDELKFPASLVALVVALVVQRTSNSRDGHVLVFLPGLEEIKAVHKALLDSNRPLLNIDFNRYEVHILHSEVPIADQQLVFAPAPRGVQRIILATNIAETSVTIPDVVYVVDAGKCKEKRFDPERHLSSLVQAFTGLGNMGQRAGRAGRHRPGEYFSLVSESRLACLPQNQTVEMKRLDLSNVVMHVKGLNLPMEVEDVLDDCIEPPGRERVVAAIKTLQRVGALDPNKNLTSLGKVLLHLPVEAAIGKLCLLGCFFRCLDQVLAIAALLTNRDPFVAPLEKRFEANMAKKRFCPPGFVSDTLTSLKAYNEWASIPSFYDQRAFCDENFLSHQGLRTIEKLRTSLIQSLDRAGVLSLAAGGDRLHLQQNREGLPVLPHFLNTNGENLPLLAALISCAVAPGFAVRKGPALLRTPQDTSATLHASSIATIVKKKLPSTSGYPKEIFAYTEASKNVSKGGAGPTSGMKMNSQLRGVTLLDPLGLLLFGVHDLTITRDGFLCDNWLPMAGKVDLLDDLQRFKDVLHACLLRAFEGLGAAMIARSKQSYSGGRSGEYTASDEYEDDPEDAGPIAPLSDQELNDLDGLAESAIDVLQQHAVDNGLPASYELARIYSSEDDYIARQYPVRKAYASDKIRVAKKEQVSHAGDDGWGMLIPAQVTASPVPQQHKQSDQLASNPSIVANVYAREQSTSQIQQAKASEPAAEDGWDSWQAKTERNDAFERRAAMQPGSSSSSSTFTDVKAGDRSVKNERADRSMEASQAGNSSQLSPLPKVNGWIGSQNMDALRLAQRDGWKDYQEKAPTVLVAPKESDSHFSPLATPQRPSANLVHVPTSSGLPENMAPNNSARTTGWGPYEKYNPRTRSSQKEVSASRDANGISSPLHKRTGSGLGMEDEYPMLPGTTSGVPFRQNESIRPASRLATWEDWKPSRHDDGETAYRNRMHTKPASPTARRTLSYKQAIPETTAAIVPEPTSSRISTEVPGDKSDVRRDALQPCQPPKETQQDENPWSRWTASIAADKQGEQNFARRAAMSREDYMPERLMPSNSLPTLPRASLLPYAQNQPPGQASSVQTAPATTDNDGWANYTPKISAEQQGKEAFERRRAMGNAKYAGRNGIPASESASSTSSTGSAFRTRFGGQESKTLSIAGRADRESSTRAAKEARLAAYKEFQNGSSTLAKNFRSLKIAGSASRAAAAHSNQPESSGQTRPSYTSAPSRILPHSAYDTPIRQPHGPSSNAGQSPEGFNQISRHRKASPSRASGANPSYAGTYTSLPNGQTQQHANGHSSNNASQPPSGGIGWD